MMKTLNQIPRCQDAEPQLTFLRARQFTYSRATRLLLVQLLITVAIPALGALLTLFHPERKPLIAAVSLLVLFFDILWLDRRQKALLKLAAKLAEHFDCAVLRLDWDEFTVGDKVEAEEIHKASKNYTRRHDDSKLRGWYPQEVGALPLRMARIVCQRTNLRYDSKLRLSYSSVIARLAVSLVVLLFIYGFVNDLSMTAWVLTFTPATPFLSWAGREFYRQRDISEPLTKLQKRAEAFWVDALTNGCSEEHCLLKSREFQNAIYNRRSSSPLIFPVVYKLMRSSLEDQMHAGATHFVQEFQQSTTSQSKGLTLAAMSEPEAVDHDISGDRSL